MRKPSAKPSSNEQIAARPVPIMIACFQSAARSARRPTNTLNSRIPAIGNVLISPICASVTPCSLSQIGR